MSSIKILFITLCWLSLCHTYTGLVSCPDKWTATTNHCYQQVVGAVANEAEAKTKCAVLGSGAIPVTVHSDADNVDLIQFLAKLLDTTLYIGLEYKAGTPAGDWDWLDGGNARTYHLWDKTADTSGESPCAFISVKSSVTSNWFTNDCKQPMQSVVCQMASRSLDTLYEELNKLKAEQQKLTDQVQKVEGKVGKGTVPVGFIYVQLPNQAPPTQLWDTDSKWADVTESYAGLFFRAEGGGSDKFNPAGVTVQTARVFDKFNIISSALKNVSHIGVSDQNSTPMNEHGKSGDIVRGGEALFLMELDLEVKDAHPLNTAVRIWRRVA